MVAFHRSIEVEILHQPWATPSYTLLTHPALGGPSLSVLRSGQLVSLAQELVLDHTVEFHQFKNDTNIICDPKQAEGFNSSAVFNQAVPVGADKTPSCREWVKASPRSHKSIGGGRRRNNGCKMTFDFPSGETEVSPPFTVPVTQS